MSLPFSPTFFRKIDIYQQLTEYESQKEKKHLWEGEKALLIWAGSEHHQHLGSPIDLHHVKNALKYCVSENYISEEEKNRMQRSVLHILESLPIHEFGEVYDNTNPKNPRIKINRNGILAGEILMETNNLTKPSKYKRWSYDWWFLYYIGGLLVVAELVSALLHIAKEIQK